MIVQTVSECCLIKVYVGRIEKYIDILARGNDQPREPALCQLYRHTFVTYVDSGNWRHKHGCVALCTAQTVVTDRPYFYCRSAFRQCFRLNAQLWRGACAHAACQCDITACSVNSRTHTRARAARLWRHRLTVSGHVTLRVSRDLSCTAAVMSVGCVGTFECGSIIGLEVNDTRSSCRYVQLVTIGQACCAR